MNKLSDIIEARYVGSNRYLIIVWPEYHDYPHGQMYYDFGVTSAPAGMYVGGNDTVAVSNSKDQSRVYAEEWIRSAYADVWDEGFNNEWKKVDFDEHHRDYGMSMEAVEKTLNPKNPEWHYDPH